MTFWEIITFKSVWTFTFQRKGLKNLPFLYFSHQQIVLTWFASIVDLFCLIAGMEKRYPWMKPCCIVDLNVVILLTTSHSVSLKTSFVRLLRCTAFNKTLHKSYAAFFVWALLIFIVVQFLMQFIDSVLWFFHLDVVAVREW